MTVVCNINYDNICSGKLQEPDKKGTHREFKPPKTEQKKQPHHALHNDGGGWVQTLLVFWEYTAKRMWTHGRHTHSFCFYNSLYESLLSSVATNRVKLSWRLVRNDQLLYGCRVKKHPILLPQTQTAGTCPNIAFKIPGDFVPPVVQLTCLWSRNVDKYSAASSERICSLQKCKILHFIPATGLLCFQSAMKAWCWATRSGSQLVFQINPEMFWTNQNTGNWQVDMKSWFLTISLPLISYSNIIIALPLPFF